MKNLSVLLPAALPLESVMSVLEDRFDNYFRSHYATNLELWTRLWSFQDDKRWRSTWKAKYFFMTLNCTELKQVKPSTWPMYSSRNGSTARKMRRTKDGRSAENSADTTGQSAAILTPGSSTSRSIWSTTELSLTPVNFCFSMRVALQMLMLAITTSNCL